MRGRSKARRLPYLVYGVIVAMLVSTVTLSRYITTVSGTGTAAVAAVDMSGGFTQQATNIDVSGMAPGAEKTTTFSVVNYDDASTSQVTLGYTIEISTTGNLPLTYALSTATLTPTNSGSGASGMSSTGEATPTQGVLPQGVRTTHTYTLTVSWPNTMTDPKYADEVDAVQLIVRSEQLMPD